MDKTQRTILAYDKHCNAYAKKFMSFSPYAGRIEEFAQWLSEGAKVLDVGCGPGNTAKHLLAQKPLELIGFDLSAEMVSLARQNVQGGIFYVQDSREAQFPEQSFDAIILSFCIVHLTHEEACSLLKKAAQWLKPGGLVYVSFMEGKEKGFETTSFSEDPIFFNYFSSNEVVELLKREQVEPFSVAKQEYPEQDGTVTTDVFIFGRKKQLP